MKVGDLVAMSGQPGFYGIVIKSSEVVRRWYVLWRAGGVLEWEESLMEVISESR